MALLANRVKMSTATTGTGTITLGSALTSYFTFAEAGVANSQVVTYQIEEGNDVEIGRGTYTSSGTTLSRDTVIASKIGGTAGTTKMTLAGAAKVSIVAVKEDLPLFTGTPAQGDVLYRDSSNWARLAAGTLRQKLLTGGAAANPSWGGGSTVIATGTLSGTAVNLTNIPQHFNYLALMCEYSFDTAARSLLIQLSNDNGASYGTTTGDYAGLWLRGGVAVTDNLVASIVDVGANTLAADTGFVGIFFRGYKIGDLGMIVDGSTFTTGGGTRFQQGVSGSLDGINAMRMILSGSGNFDGSTVYSLIGYI